MVIYKANLDYVLFRLIGQNFSLFYNVNLIKILSLIFLSLTMLKMTKTELELIPDPDMFIFFEKGTRGGISDISNR